MFPNQLTIVVILAAQLVTIVFSSPAISPSYGVQVGPKEFPPAEPDYPPVQGRPRSEPLPLSDKEAIYIDKLPAAPAISTVVTDEDGKVTYNVNGGIFAHVNVEDDGDDGFKIERGMGGDPNEGVIDVIQPTTTTTNSEKKPVPAEDEFVISQPAQSFDNSKPRGEQPSLVMTGQAVSYPKMMTSIANPTNYYLEGANLSNVHGTQCQMTGCQGPYPDDGNLYVNRPQASAGQACHQTFVPLNSCIGEKGYPVGMVCTICCNCAPSFAQEMQKSRGYVSGFDNA